MSALNLQPLACYSPLFLPVSLMFYGQRVVVRQCSTMTFGCLLGLSSRAQFSRARCRMDQEELQIVYSAAAVDKEVLC
jgi:hypothetical protein